MSGGQKSKVIQVGIGIMGNVWVRTVMASREVEFAGFVEISDQTIEKRVLEHGLDRKIIFKSLPEALNTVKPDGIIDVTPPQVHEEISFISLEAGIPVLSEKPLSDNRESARRIVRKSSETGVLHMVAQNYRYSGAIPTLKKVLDEKNLGRPEMVYISLFEDPALEDADRREYITKYWNKLPYPALVDSAVHHCDLIRFLFDTEPITIYGKSYNPSWSIVSGHVCFSTIIELENGMHVSCNVSCCSAAEKTGWEGSWRIECERGCILVRNAEVWLFPAGKEPTRVEEVKLPYSGQAYLLHEFHQALTKGIRPATTCQDNIKTMSMVFDIIKSFETGSPVKCKD